MLQNYLLLKTNELEIILDRLGQRDQERNLPQR